MFAQAAPSTSGVTIGRAAAGPKHLGPFAHLLGAMTFVAANGDEALLSAVALAAGGDEQAFARIVAAHQDDLTRVAFVICRDPDMTADAVQQAWSIAWRQLPRLREPERLRSWLVAIAANEARQIVRRDRRRNVVELDVSTGGPAIEGGGDWSDSVDLRNALANLSADDRALLALRYVAGLDSSELSRFTRLSPSGTRARLARLLAGLREELGDA